MVEMLNFTRHSRTLSACSHLSKFKICDLNLGHTKDKHKKKFAIVFVKMFPCSNLLELIRKVFLAIHWGNITFPKNGRQTCLFRYKLEICKIPGYKERNTRQLCFLDFCVLVIYHVVTKMTRNMYISKIS